MDRRSFLKGLAVAPVAVTAAAEMANAAPVTNPAGKVGLFVSDYGDLSIAANPYPGTTKVADLPGWYTDYLGTLRVPLK